MTSKFVSVEKGLGPEGGIAIVRFDRGDKRRLACLGRDLPRQIASGAACAADRSASRGKAHSGLRESLRIKPSWQTEAMSLPSRVKTLPRQKPRAPWLDGLSWA
jgi:hypothetical protein